MALAVLAAAPGLWRLRLRTDGGALVPETAPQVICDRAIRTRFGVEDQFVVIIRSSHPDGIFNPATISLIRELTESFRQMPGADGARVISLATEASFRFRPGTAVNQRLLEPALTSRAELNQLRDDLHRIRLYTGTILSTDGQSSVILLPAPRGSERARFYERIQQIIASKRIAQDQIAVAGAPVAELLLGNQILEDLGVPSTLLGNKLTQGTSETQTSIVHRLRIFAARRIGMVPLALLVIVAVFFVCFRKVFATLLPLAGAGVTLVIVLGTMGWAGVPLYLTTAVMPVLLTVLSVTNDIYLFNRFLNLLREQPDQTSTALLEQTFASLASPTACTSLASLAGFLSFAFSPLVPVRAFGVFSGLGAVVGLLFSLTVVPALLVLAPRAWVARRASSRLSWLERWFAQFGEMLVRRRWYVVGCVIAIVALTPIGLRKLAVQDSWTSGFEPESDFRQVTRRVNEGFFGTHLLFISLEAQRTLSGQVSSSEAFSGLLALPKDLVQDPVEIEGSRIKFSIPWPADQTNSSQPGQLEWWSQIRNVARLPESIFARCFPPDRLPALEDKLRQYPVARFEIADQTQLRPDVIEAVGKMGSFIRQKQAYQVGGVLTAADYLETSRFMLRYSDPQARRLPESAAEAKLLWLDYGAVLGPQRLRQVVDTNYTASLTTVFLKEANFADTARLVQDLRAYERRFLAPKGIKMEFGGDVGVSQSLIAGIVTTQLQSLIWSLAGIFAVTAIMGRSAKWGLFCLAPSLLAVLVKLAIMGWAGIPLGVATSMFAAMTLGIGVNCAIQLLEGCRQANAGGNATNPSSTRSLRVCQLQFALAVTGPSALINTIAVSLGFGVFMLSQVPANARLGFLLVLGLVSCFVASMLLLPLLLYWWPLQPAGVSHSHPTRGV